MLYQYHCACCDKVVASTDKSCPYCGSHHIRSPYTTMDVLRDGLSSSCCRIQSCSSLYPESSRYTCAIDSVRCIK